jgi:hypothetical protein
MNVLHFDQGAEPENDTPKQRGFWHGLAQKLDALAAYPTKHVSEGELRRFAGDIGGDIGGDIAWRRRLMFKKPHRRRDAMLGRGAILRAVRTGSKTLVKFPQRPDLTVLSETIPLFYIGQSRHGFWLVREADGRSGGLFLFRRSAVRFAQKKSAPAGCAMMYLNEPFELDLENQGGRFIAAVAATMDVVVARAPTFAAFIGMAVSEWRKLLSQLSRAVAGERRNRAALERELFHGHYKLSSKSDDDLPIP